MAEAPQIRRLKKVAVELNVGVDSIVKFLERRGIKVDSNPNAKIDSVAYNLLLEEFQSEKEVKEESRLQGMKDKLSKTTISIEDTDRRSGKKPEEEEFTIRGLGEEEVIRPKVEEKGPTVVGRVDLDALTRKTRPDKKEKKAAPPPEKPETIVPEKETPPVSEPREEALDKWTGRPVVKDEDVIKAQSQKLEGPKVVGKMDLPVPEPKKKPVATSGESHAEFSSRKKKRRRIRKKIDKVAFEEEKSKFGKKKKERGRKAEVSAEEVDRQVKETLEQLSGAGKSKASKYRKAKREAISEQMEEDLKQAEAEKQILKVTEFVTANELATMMNVPVTEIISACMSLGMFVSINQRLDAETLSIVAEEFGFKVEFTTAEVQEAIAEQEDSPEDLLPRPPIVTVMGHVDHGKTSLLDYIRKTNVIAGEAGGITQHIGAYNVEVGKDKRITFLDTPGHEAFTAMRARGAKITDIAIIVIAADDNVMPQTKEAINHAQAAGVPMIFAINKIDKPGASPDKIREELSQLNILVEEWGGKYQCQEISAKKGTNVGLLLEKVLLEAELLDLKANPHRNASGAVIESALDKGRGYVTTILVQKGNLKIGDVLLAGCFSGRVKAMFNERGLDIEEAGPSIPVSLLGLNGAPNAGDKFNVLDDEREAREIANKRLQLLREQGVRTKKHITLDEIGRRLAIGNFKELNIIVKGDVDGSVEALTDSLLKLSTEKIQVNVIHKSVGQISESDVLLASASDAIIVGFQVRPSGSARRLAEKEQIDIRLYSIIYNAIEELKAAMEGMLEPTTEEKIICNIEVRDVFKISKVGAVAGCYVTDGKIQRNTKVRVIRDGIVVYNGTLGSLKRFKDDVREVAAGYECGLNINNFNDIKAGDIIEGFEEVQVKQTL